MKRRCVNGESIAKEIVGSEKEQTLGNPLGPMIILEFLEANRSERHSDCQRNQRAVRNFPDVNLGQRWRRRTKLYYRPLLCDHEFIFNKDLLNFKVYLFTFTLLSLSYFRFKVFDSQKLFDCRVFKMNYHEIQ